MSDTAAIQIAVATIVIEVIIAILTVAVSYSIIKKEIKANRQIAQKEIEANRQIAQEFGDLAGQQAARRYEEEKAAKARIIALQALLNETKRIRKAVNHNIELKESDTVQTIIQLPTIALETAFFSQEHALLTTTSTDLDKTPSLLTHTLDYLTIANAANSLNDLYPVININERRYIAREISDTSKRLPSILDQLEKSLKDELSKSSPKNSI